MSEVKSNERLLSDWYDYDLRPEGLELGQLRTALAWQPIATAPRDGTPVLVTNGFPPVVLAENRYDSDDAWTFAYGCSECRDTVYPNPTHWMPLPTAPDHPRR